MSLLSLNNKKFARVIVNTILLDYNEAVRKAAANAIAFNYSLFPDEVLKKIVHRESSFHVLKTLLNIKTTILSD